MQSALNHAFGQIITVSGKIVDGDQTGERRYSGEILISIETVNGAPLKPVLMPVETFSFAKIKMPKPGVALTVKGYESGGFTGIPSEAFEDIPRVATDGFHFRSRFVVTKIID